MSEMNKAVAVETGSLNTKVKLKVLVDESRNQPRTIQNDNGS